MPSLSRTFTVALLATLALLLILGGWFGTGWRSSSKEAEALRKAPRQAAQASLGELAMELTGRLDSVRSKENGRPYYHYQNLFHDPRGVSAGKSVSPSPLVDDTGDPLIAAHFQIDASGTLSIPPLNEELAQFSAQSSLAANTQRLAELRAAQAELSESPVLVASNESPSNLPEELEQAPSPQQTQGQALQQEEPVQQAIFAQEAFMQNAAPNSVFVELENQTKKGRGKTVSSSPKPDAIEVATHGFRWRTAHIGGQPELVALRRIETPEGNLTQGFVVGSKELAEWMEARAKEELQVQLRYRDTPVASPHRISLPLPALAGLFLESDISEQQELANQRAQAVRRDFVWRFAPTSAVALLLVIGVVIVVSRSERLARERSQFAAAAAHELRTPLAGLQLYGDMLAEGLGDQNAKDKYARLISDEAQRLGRVVSNVLDFSQMEKKSVHLQPRVANLAESVRQIVERMRRPLEHAGMQIEMRVPEALEARYDEDAVSRILQNLLDNAEKYTREHEERRLQVTLELEQGCAQISVADNGDGVKGAMRAHIFKPFGRNAGQDGPAGLGLGLALSRALAQQQGGDLQVHDGPLGGASFVLQLPQS